jgi:hypothetical protein
VKKVPKENVNVRSAFHSWFGVFGRLLTSVASSFRLSFRSLLRRPSIAFDQNGLYLGITIEPAPNEVVGSRLKTLFSRAVGTQRTVSAFPQLYMNCATGISH